MHDDDPTLDAVVDAILDGAPVDEKALASSSADPALGRQLRVLADLAGLHRALSSGQVQASLQDDAPGRSPVHWGHLHLLEKVGQGAFGEVYRAWDPRLSREVALKLFRPAGDPSDPIDQSRVLEEARFLAAVRHPNVVTVHGADRIDGRVGFWTEFIHGRTLAARVHERGTFEANEAAAIGIDVCRALAAVHHAGLLHRDIKATNVMQEDSGRNVLLDFGASQGFTPGSAPAGHVANPYGPTGTPLYVAPELWRGAAATPQSDIYGLGVLLYFLVTATYPVEGRTADDVDAAHQSGRRARLGEARAELPVPFVMAVERAIDPDPSRRFESAAAFERALAQLGVPASSTTSPVKGLRWHWRAAAAVAVVVLLTGYLALSMRARAHVDHWTSFRAPDGLAGHPSRDGRMLPYVQGGDVKVFEVATGRSRLIAERSGDDVGVSWQLDPHGERLDAIPWAPVVMSPNGDRIAYTWAVGPASSNQYELRLANADGTWARTILERRSAYQPVPVDWSSDGRGILCWLTHQGGAQDLVLISTSDGSIRVLYSKVGGIPSTSLSPDGRAVAIVQARREGGRVVPNVFILDIGGDAHGQPRELFPAGETAQPIWVDDTHLFFLKPSPEYPTLADGWVARVIDGTVRGTPAIVLPGQLELGPGTLALTTGASLQTVKTKYSNEVYTATIDLTGGTPPGPPVRVSENGIDHHLAPSWSPDGRFIAYLTGRPSRIPWSRDEPVLTILDVATGAIREVEAHLTLGRLSPQWSADGTSVLVFGSELFGKGVSPQQTDSRAGWYGVDVRTGEAHAVILQLSQLAQFLSDRRVLYQDPPAKQPLTLRKFGEAGETIEEMVIATDAESQGRFAVSPNEHWLACETYVRAGQGWISSGIEVKPLAGGPAHEIVRATPPDVVRLHAWTPDGQSLLYTQGSGEAPRPLWIVDASGGQPRDLHIKIPTSPRPLAINRSGDRIVYPEMVTEPTLWIRPLSLPTRFFGLPWP